MKTMTIKECCCFLKKLRNPSKAIQHAILASETSFSINEIEALYDLFERLSHAIVEDGRIHKVIVYICFDTFDIKKNGVIEFDVKFVRSLVMFKFYDLEAQRFSLNADEGGCLWIWGYIITVCDDGLSDDYASALNARVRNKADGS
ncbi:hypothetical protein R6Q57_007267 [Mikania cordata]